MASPRWDMKNGSFDKALGLFLCGALLGNLLDLFLFFRPSPIGMPYVLDSSNYLPQALLYSYWGMALLSLPFFIYYLMGKTARWPLMLQLVLIVFSLILYQGDHEVLRYYGTHCNLDFLTTYRSVQSSHGVILQALADDKGGAYLALLLGLIPLSLLLFFPFLSSWFTPATSSRRSKRGLAVLLLALYIGCFITWNFTKSSARRERVKPPLMLLLSLGRELLDVPTLFAREPLPHMTARYQRWWKAADHSGQWTFADKAFPLRKHHLGPCQAAAERRPNFIFIQLETYRAKELHITNPYASAATNPFIEALAVSPNAAYWPRFYANGAPTASAFLNIQASLLPHSARMISTAYTWVALDALPALLGKAGYKTFFGTTADPDWDNQRHWLGAWYQEVLYAPTYQNADRPQFRDSVSRIRELGRSGSPFFAYIVSLSNHFPFHSKDPAFDVSKGTRPVDLMRNTMHYTDDVVRELVESIKGEPWFDDTILVLTGDHGFDLGERGETRGFENLHHEVTWVPLIVYGKDPRLPKGRQNAVASHIDLAPTMLDLAGVCPDNSFMGHSLLTTPADSGAALSIFQRNYAMETRDFSLYLSAFGELQAYAPADVLQVKAIHPPAAVKSLINEAVHISEFTDYLVEKNRIAPAP